MKQSVSCSQCGQEIGQGITGSGLMSDEDTEKLEIQLLEEVQQARKDSFDEARIDDYEARVAA